MLLHASVPAEKGNEALDSGEMARTLMGLIEQVKAEASYFYADHNGNRSALVVFDMQDSAQLPSIAEPLFHAFNATVHVTPVMNAEDLQRGMPGAA